MCLHFDPELKEKPLLMLKVPGSFAIKIVIQVYPLSLPFLKCKIRKTIFDHLQVRQLLFRHCLSLNFFVRFSLLNIQLKGQKHLDIKRLAYFSLCLET